MYVWVHMPSLVLIGSAVQPAIARIHTYRQTYRLLLCRWVRAGLIISPALDSNQSLDRQADQKYNECVAVPSVMAAIVSRIYGLVFLPLLTK